jgi:hypothetical protein
MYAGYKVEAHGPTQGLPEDCVVPIANPLSPYSGAMNAGVRDICDNRGTPRLETLIARVVEARRITGVAQKVAIKIRLARRAW